MEWNIELADSALQTGDLSNSVTFILRGSYQFTILPYLENKGLEIKRVDKEKKKPWVLDGQSLNLRLV